MSDIPPIKNPVSPAGMTPQPTPKGGQTVGDDAARGAASVDRVEISEMGQLLSTLEPDTDIRAEKVMAIREAITNGTYETEAKLEYTIERLLEVLRSRD